MAPPQTTTITTKLTPPPQTLYTLLFLFLLFTLGYYTLPPHNHHHPPPPPAAAPATLFLSTSSNDTISTYLRRLTIHPHLAGTTQSLSVATFVKTHFTTHLNNSHSTPYSVLLSYPSRASLSLHFPDNNNNKMDRIFVLRENGVSDDVVMPYHAYSPSGSVRARVVFANYGRMRDYVKLNALGVNVTGCVVLVRRGGGGRISRAGVVAVAESVGAAAVLMYVDGGSGGGGGVERGTVMRGVGDPLTPGWAAAAEDGGERLPEDDEEVARKFPRIPSLPLSYENAEVILRSLGGVSMPVEWSFGSGLGRARSVGPGPAAVNFTYQGEKKVVTIQNIFSIIRGSEEPDRYVILGNHRDAWSYGAVDPSSGTAVVLDIARRFSILLQMGWKPRRSIILASWDAEEFGMVGSTEWVEENLLNLNSKAVAYLNIDCAVQGTGFFAGATPQLDNLLLEVTKNVSDPDSVGTTIYEKWAATNQFINGLSGVDSDFAPFLQHAGVPSIDIYYGKDYPVYHTAFDSYEWMTSNADPLFHRHVAVSGIWGLLALRLADDVILPFDYLCYADRLKKQKDTLSRLLPDPSIFLHPLITAIQQLASAAKEIKEEAVQLREEESRGDFVTLKLRSLNDRLMLAERGFLDVDGLPGRPWFKHLIYGPPSSYDSKLDFFPSIADAISRSEGTSPRDQQVAIQHEVWRVARAIERAASALKGQLT